MGITNLDEQFTFYASYHHSTMNKLIHIGCVWPILWSALVLTEYAPFPELPFLPSAIGTFIHPPNLTLLVAIFYAGVYILMDKRAGSLAAFLVLLCLLTSRRFYLGAEISWGYPAWQLAAGLHAICWVAQFVGHGVFEGRSPALLDNLMQALVMAPLFVLLEVMFFFGYRKDFQKRMWVNVNKEIAKFKNGKKSINNNSSSPMKKMNKGGK